MSDGMIFQMEVGDQFYFEQSPERILTVQQRDGIKIVYHDQSGIGGHTFLPQPSLRLYKPRSPDTVLVEAVAVIASDGKYYIAGSNDKEHSPPEDWVQEIMSELKPPVSVTRVVTELPIPTIKTVTGENRSA